MPPTAQAAPPTQPQQGGGLDPQAVMLAKSIRTVESQNNFQATGKSGEYGAYQYLPTTWAAQSQKYLGQSVPLQQATPEQQNQVAYSQIKEWKDQGYNPGQIASMWNAGPGRPNAYLQGNAGVNKYGASYDTAAYAQKVATTYQQLKNEDQSNSNQMQSQSGGGGLLGALGSAAKWGLNTFAPIVPDIYHDIAGDSNKNWLQQAGDLGTTGLTAATVAAPEIFGPAALGEAAGLRAGSVGAAALGGAGIGAGYGLTGGVGAGQSGGQLAGNIALGGATGGALGAATQGISNAIGGIAAETPESRLQAQTTRLKTLTNVAAKNPDAISTMVDSKLMPAVIDGKVDSTAVQEGMQSLIDGQDAAATKLVSQIPGTVSRDELQSLVESKIYGNPAIAASGKLPQTLAAAQTRFDSFAQSYGEQIPWSAVNDIRIAMNKEWDPAEQDAARAIGDAARDFLYQGGDPELKQIMAQQGKYIQAKTFAKALHGTAVKGGRLGKYAAEGVGGLVGFGLGSLGGPVGEGIGAYAGSQVAEKMLAFSQSNAFNPLLAPTAQRLQSLLQSGPGSTAGALGRSALLRGLTGGGQ